MSTQVKRIYKGKDVEMLTATATIIEQGINHKTFLISKRSTWADPFFPGLQTRIQNAFKNYLGIDNYKALRKATQTVYSIQYPSIKWLGDFKLQIVEDFKKDQAQKIRRKEILTQLGFNAHYKDTTKKDQEALVELLLKFDTNMTSALETEVTAKGIDPALINNIRSNANILNSSNINQETLKGTKKTVTNAAITEFNDIYSEVISVARISARFFQKEPAVKAQFSYAKTLKNLNRPKAEQVKQTTPAPVNAIT